MGPLPGSAPAPPGRGLDELLGGPYEDTKDNFGGFSHYGTQMEVEGHTFKGCSSPRF